MALLFCKKCGHLYEVDNKYLDKLVKCPQCAFVVRIYDTVYFLKKIIDKYREQQKILQQLQKTPTKQPAPLTDIQKRIGSSQLHNTTVLTQQTQYAPVLEWFKQKNINVQINQNALDTTGFFDEIALHLGNQYKLLGEIIDKIKYAQSKSYTDVRLTLDKKSQKEIATITQFCRLLYEYSFVAKYFYQNKEKIIRLKLQTAAKIVKFFNGEWMEWFVFIQLLTYCQQKGLPYSILRNLIVQFPNKDSHELDIFCLLDNRIAVCIECKSGEFRHDIKKYSNLRKRLGLDERSFFLCVLGLNQKQTEGMTSMYDFIFVNEQNFLLPITLLLG